MTTKYRFSLVAGAARPDSLVQLAQSVEEITTQLSKVRVGPKDGPAIIPATFSVPYRKAENVDEITMLGLDFDHGRPDAIAKAGQGFRRWGWETYSHVPSEPHRRYLLPLAEPLPLYKAPRDWYRQLAEHVGAAFCCDMSCANADRLYYLPTKPRADAARETIYIDGPELDWRDVFDCVENGRNHHLLPTNLQPLPADERPLDSADVLSTLNRLARYAARCGAINKKRAINNVLQGQMPTPPPADRTQDDPARNPAWLWVTDALATCAPTYAKTEDLAELLRPAWNDEVSQVPGDFTSWETIVGMLRRARPKAAAKQAARAQRQAF